MAWLSSYHRCRGNRHVLFALVPALQVTRPNVNASLQEGNRAVQAANHNVSAASFYLASELSLLLWQVPLLIKSFGNLRATNPGLNPTRVMTADFVLPRAKYSEPEQQRLFFERFLPKLAALPEWKQSAGHRRLPFSGSDSANSFWIVGRPDPGLGNHPDASNLIVAADYFRAIAFRC